MMSRILKTLLCTVLGFAFAGPIAHGQNEGVEPQARGPVHEGFANPVDGQPGPGRIVDREPPAMIEELPAEQKPEGEVIWIPGYWAWDDARGDFLWVSGFWRVPPPSRTWIPGSWRQAGEGWQWTPGYWAADDDTENHYLPPPPESIETGPSVPQPSDDHIYVPGSYVYVTNRFVWRPGTWVLHRPGWCWIPAHYRWTPAGYLFIAGYWDYPLANRGVLFAPVWIDRRIALRPRWYYTPVHAIYDGALYGSLFVRPGYSHYYFGDYFDARFTTLGYRSWFSVSIGRGYAYDPLFSYYRATYRRDPYWAPAIREIYVGRYAGHIARPPVTVVNNITNVNIINQTVINKYTNINKSTNITNITNVNNTVINVKNINNTTNNTIVKNNESLQKLVQMKPVAQDQREKFVKESREIRTLGNQRLQAETQLAKGAPIKANDPPKSVKLELSKPIKSVNAGAGAGAKVPPPAVTIKPTITTKPGTGSNDPVIGRPKPPVVDPKLPVKDPKPPVVNPKPPIKDPMPPVKDPKPPVVNPKPPIKDPMPPVKDPKPPVVNPKPPIKDPMPPVVNPKPPVKDPKPPVVNPKPPVKDPKPPVRDPKPPKKDKDK